MEGVGDGGALLDDAGHGGGGDAEDEGVAPAGAARHGVRDVRLLVPEQVVLPVEPAAQARFELAKLGQATKYQRKGRDWYWTKESIGRKGEIGIGEIGGIPLSAVGALVGLLARVDVLVLLAEELGPEALVAAGVIAALPGLVHSTQPMLGRGLRRG